MQQSIFYEILMNNLLTNHLWSESIKFYLMNEQCWYGCYAIGNIVLCCQPKHLSSEEYSAFRLWSVKIRSLSKLSICCRSQTRSRKSNCLIVFSDILKTQLNASERLQIATLLTYSQNTLKSSKKQMWIDCQALIERWMDTIMDCWFGPTHYAPHRHTILQFPIYIHSSYDKKTDQFHNCAKRKKLLCGI